MILSFPLFSCSFPFSAMFFSLFLCLFRFPLSVSAMTVYRGRSGRRRLLFGPPIPEVRTHKHNACLLHCLILSVLHLHMCASFLVLFLLCRPEFFLPARLPFYALLLIFVSSSSSFCVLLPCLCAGLPLSAIRRSARSKMPNGRSDLGLFFLSLLLFTLHRYDHHRQHQHPA